MKTIEDAENEFEKLINGKGLPTKHLTEVAEHYFITGYQIAQEKSYSTEEIIEILLNFRGENPRYVEEWFEQFKK